MRRSLGRRTVAIALLVAVVLSSVVAQAATDAPPSCSVDADCPVQQPHCQLGVCKLLVPSGQFCSAHSDCASYVVLGNSSCTASCSIEAVCQNRQRSRVLNDYLSGGRTNTKSDLDIVGAPPSSQLCCAALQLNSQCVAAREGDPQHRVPVSKDEPKNILYQVTACDAGLECKPGGGKGDNSSTCQWSGTRSRWVIGVLISIVSNIVLNLGLNVQKYAFNKNQALPEELHKPEYKLPIWLLGFGVWLLGNIGNFVALPFAAQSLLAPLGAISLISNAIFAPLINKEPFGRRDMLAIALIAIGSVIVVVFSNHQDTTYSLCALLSFYRRGATIAYLIFVASLVVVLWCFIHVAELARHRARGSVTDAEDSAGNTLSRVDIIAPSDSFDRSSVASETFNTSMSMDRRDLAPPDAKSYKMWTLKGFRGRLALRKEVHDRMDSGAVTDSPTNSLRAQLHPPPAAAHRGQRAHGGSARGRPSRMHIPFLSKLVVRPDSFAGRVLLPFSYACIGGVLGGLTILLAKSAAELVTLTIAGDNQFGHAASYFIIVGVVLTGFGQIYYINAGIKNYDALLQVPAYFVVFTLCSIVSAAIYFDDFSNFSAVQYVLFIVGVIITFGGVGVLAGRLSSGSPRAPAAEADEMDEMEDHQSRDGALNDSTFVDQQQNGATVAKPPRLNVNTEPRSPTDAPTSAVHLLDSPTDVAAPMQARSPPAPSFPAAEPRLRRRTSSRNSSLPTAAQATMPTPHPPPMVQQSSATLIDPLRDTQDDIIVSPPQSPF
ncbi:hypothetical protein RI367_004174 [Sorochytrium milnesiophthora]